MVYDAVTVDTPEVYAVARRAGHTCSILLVNLSSRSIECTCSVDPNRLPLQPAEVTIHDMWPDEYSHAPA